MRPRSLGPPRKPPGRRGAGGRAGFPTRSFGQSGRWEPAGRGQEKVGRRLGSCPRAPVGVPFRGPALSGLRDGHGDLSKGFSETAEKVPLKGFPARRARVPPS